MLRTPKHPRRRVETPETRRLPKKVVHPRKPPKTPRFPWEKKDVLAWQFPLAISEIVGIIEIDLVPGTMIAVIATGTVIGTVPESAASLESRTEGREVDLGVGSALDLRRDGLLMRTTIAREKHAIEIGAALVVGMIERNEIGAVQRAAKRKVVLVASNEADHAPGKTAMIATGVIELIVAKDHVLRATVRKERTGVVRACEMSVVNAADLPDVRGVRSERNLVMSWNEHVIAAASLDLVLSQQQSQMTLRSGKLAR